MVHICRREAVTLLDLAYNYGSAEDKRSADLLQKRLLHDDSKECGVMNRIVSAMKDFKKHDRKIANQARRESREYGVDLIKTLHVVLRVYERLSKSNFSVKKRTRYHTETGTGGAAKRSKQGGKGKKKAKPGVTFGRDDDEDEGEDEELQEEADDDGANASDKGADAADDTDEGPADGSGSGKISGDDGKGGGKVRGGVDLPGMLVTGAMPSRAWCWLCLCLPCAPIKCTLATSQLALYTCFLTCALQVQGQEQEEERIRAVDVERSLCWEHLMKAVGHTEVVKMYMFLLEKYNTLDAAALHAIAAFLRRVTNDLQLGPMLYQVRSTMRSACLLCQSWAQTSLPCFDVQ